MIVHDDEGKDTDEIFAADEGIRPDSTVEALANLKPAFKEDGKVTAGNSSQITDGSSAVLIMSEEKANALGLRPRARFHAFALAGVDPVTMLTGPIPATTTVLERAKLTHRRHRRRRDQRGLRLGRAGVGEGAPPQHGDGEPQRRRHRAGPPAGCLGRQAHGHAAQRARADQRPLGPAHHVRGRRAGERHGHRAPGLSQSSLSSSGRGRPPRAFGAPGRGTEVGDDGVVAHLVRLAQAVDHRPEVIRRGRCPARLGPSSMAT